MGAASKLSHRFTDPPESETRPFPLGACSETQQPENTRSEACEPATAKTGTYATAAQLLFNFHAVIQLGIPTLLLGVSLGLAVYKPILGVVLMPLIVFALAQGATIALTLFELTAQGEPVVEDWPEMNPIAWLDAALFLIAGILIAGTPMFFMTTIMMLPAWVRFAATLVGVFLFLPIVWLSMSRNQSVAVPVSTEVLALMRSQPGSLLRHLIGTLPICALWFALPLMTLRFTDQPVFPVVLGTTGVVLLTTLFLYAVSVGELARTLDPPTSERTEPE